MPKKLHYLITNTTSLIGYIAFLMFAGAYLGGDNGTMNGMAIKGNLGEYNHSQYPASASKKFVLITIDGRQYRAEIYEEENISPNIE